MNVNSEIVKISFIGDITCDRPMLKASIKEDGTYDFSESLEDIKKITLNSDYTVANLETVFAGKDRSYNPNPITYNSPIELLETIKDLGINFLSTANNHCIDFGVDGIKSTINELKKYNLDYTGTFLNKDEKRYKIIEVKGIKIGFISFTDFLNPKVNGVRYDREILNYVNFIGHYKDKDIKEKTKDFIKTVLPMEKINQYRAARKRKMGIPLVKRFKDDNKLLDIEKEQILSLKETFLEMKEEVDFSVLLLHAGGQFHREVGNHTLELVREVIDYVDVIVGHHPHVIQKIEKIKGKYVAYSLGSLNMSMGADYISHEDNPDLSMIFNIYLKNDGEESKIDNVSISLIKNNDIREGYTKVSPISKDDNLSQDEKRNILNLVSELLNKKITELSDEYFID